MDIEVVKHSRQKLSLKANLNKALQALYKNRCFVFKKVTSVKPALPKHLASLDYIKRDIVLNEISIFWKLLEEDWYCLDCPNNTFF